MYIELKCRSCGKAFRVDFTNNEYDVDKCPKCGRHLSSSDVARIRAITEPFYTNAAELKKVTQLQKQWALRKPSLDAHCLALQKEILKLEQEIDELVMEKLKK